MEENKEVELCTAEGVPEEAVVQDLGVNVADSVKSLDVGPGQGRRA